MTEKKRFNSYCDNENIRIRIDDNIKNKEVFHIYFVELDDALYCKSKLNPILDLLNSLNDENEEFKKALIELKEIGDYQDGRIKELSDENEQLEQQLNYIQNSISEHIKHQKTELGQKALKEIIEDYNEWLLGHKELKE